MVELSAPARQDFVCIGLVPHIPHYFVLRKIQRQMQCHGQFHRTEITGKMSAGHTDLFNQKLSDLLRKLFIGILRYFLDIIWFIYSL